MKISNRCIKQQEASSEDLRRMSYYHKQLIVAVVDTDNVADPKAAEILTDLYARGLLKTFMKVYTEHIPIGSEGNCHDVAFALMANLLMVGKARGWVWATGHVELLSGRGMHSWLEFDGWAVDATANRCIIQRTDHYYARMKVSRVSYRNSRQSKRNISRQIERLAKIERRKSATSKRAKTCHEVIHPNANAKADLHEDEAAQ